MEPALGSLMRIAVIFGTRPEAIKMAPVVRALRASPEIDCRVWSTGQHREMLAQVLDIFDLTVDDDLALMTPGQSLNGLFAGAVAGVDAMIERASPDMVLVHGDTSTAAAAATAAFHRKVKVGHVEAGLRSGRMDQPWPEEFNRRLVDLVSSQLFAPTDAARDHLLAEGVDSKRVMVTGNTVVDALLTVVDRIRTQRDVEERLRARFDFIAGKPMVLVTGHRRESFGDGFKNICLALKMLSQANDLQIIYPVHLNPNVQGPVHELLADCPGVHLIPPVDYEAFVYLMMRSSVILTDSGGVQEEAPSLSKPVLVMRNVTERPEAVAAGVSELVGTDPDRIVSGVLSALSRAGTWDGRNPYGDGNASQRIVKGILDGVDNLC